MNWFVIGATVLYAAGGIQYIMKGKVVFGLVWVMYSAINVLLMIAERGGK